VIFYKSKMSKAHLHLQLKVECENLKADINAPSRGFYERCTASKIPADLVCYTQRPLNFNSDSSLTKSTFLIAA
jgi:hypothetical protein